MVARGTALLAVVCTGFEPVPVSSRVSVVIVSFNTRDKLRRCLSCIEPEHDVIVVDNASTDGSPQMVGKEFDHRRLIENTQNVGFGAANNQGMAVARRELVLFLNSDCYAAPGAIAKLSTALDNFSVVGAGGKLLNPDGSLHESVAGPLTLWAVFLEQSYLEKLFGGYWRTKQALQRAGEGEEPRATGRGGVARSESVGETGIAEVVQVMGACLMIRPVETFDERFFLYCEDTDLCLRLKKHGSIVYVPAADFTHELGSSSVGSARWLSVARYNRGKELYFAIHRGNAASVVCWLLNRKGAFLRLAAYGLATLGTLGINALLRQRVALWWRVLTAPRLGPDRPARTSE